MRRTLFAAFALFGCLCFADVGILRADEAGDIAKLIQDITDKIIKADPSTVNNSGVKTAVSALEKALKDKSACVAPLTAADCRISDFANLIKSWSGVVLLSTEQLKSMSDDVGLIFSLDKPLFNAPSVDALLSSQLGLVNATLDSKGKPSSPNIQKMISDFAVTVGKLSGYLSSTTEFTNLKGDPLQTFDTQESSALNSIFALQAKHPTVDNVQNGAVKLKALIDSFNPQTDDDRSKIYAALNVKDSSLIDKITLIQPQKTAIDVAGSWYGDVKAIGAEIDRFRATDNSHGLRFCAATEAVRLYCQGKPACFFLSATDATKPGTPGYQNGSLGTAPVDFASLMCGYDPTPYADKSSVGLVVAFRCLQQTQTEWDKRTREKPVRANDPIDPKSHDFALLHAGVAGQIRCGPDSAATTQASKPPP